MGITLARSGVSITLTDDLDVERSVGRPNSKVQGQPSEKPLFIDKQQSAVDVFEISGEFTSSAAESDASRLVEDIVRPQLGRRSLVLRFDNSLYGLGTYDVFPDGSQAGRVSYSAGEKGVVRVDSLTLRVVNNS